MNTGSDLISTASPALGKAAEDEVMLKLHEVAKGGNVEAINALRKVQAFNRYNELLNHMDDDEFTD